MSYEKIRIALSGNTGKMGTVISDLIDLDPNLFLQSVLNKDTSIEKEEWSEKDIDLVLDFSLPESFSKSLTWAYENKKPFVSGTTGLDSKTKEKMMEYSSSIPIFYSANMSFGIWQIKKWLSDLSDGGISKVELEESHHKNKKDKPSGTALVLKEYLPESLKKDLEIVSHREEDVFGIHKLKFIGEEEYICLEHKALSRKLFAKGALKASKWLMGKKNGFYSIEDMYQ